MTADLFGLCFQGLRNRSYSKSQFLHQTRDNREEVQRQLEASWSAREEVACAQEEARGAKEEVTKAKADAEALREEVA